ncbi:MAG: DUF1295 domain-containing protein [Gammaproteobacteria bacterium]|nr:DUF1295 domain-containing protein [Gammaproteobacteria bacterium]
MDLSLLNFINHPMVGTPYGSVLDLAIVLAITCWLLSVITREYSWVDRVWSVAPAIFCLLVASSANFESSRLNLMTLLICLWAIRMTFNSARRGYYQPGGEDYRWAYLCEKLGPTGFQALNLFFIAPGLLLVVWLFTSPIHHAWTAMESPLNWLDGLAAALFALFWIGEAVADQQMWRFQQQKKARQGQGLPIETPFITTGLFQYCRHPNFFCELGMWWVFYLFAIAATDKIFNWSGLGFLALTGLFLGSTRVTESISASRYPSYRAYQARVSRLIPFTRLGCIKSAS